MAGTVKLEGNTYTVNRQYQIVGKSEKKILDCTCGGRSVWTKDNKNRNDTIYSDLRSEESGFHGQTGRTYSIDPDIIADNRELPFCRNTFDLVIFDPPHVRRENGMNQLSGIVIKKYGALTAETWQSDLHEAVSDIFRVLTESGTLVFKFSSVDIGFQEVLSELPVEPLLGTTSMKKQNSETQWFVFHASQYEN